MYYALSTSILEANFGELANQVRSVDAAGADFIHIDVMDGTFVPSKSFGMPVIASIRDVTERLFDVHMMVAEPDRYVKDMVDCGADIITVHEEACTHLDRTIRYIKSYGLKAGVALNPGTNLNCLEYILEDVDMVLLMTVNPGLDGQKFIPQMVEKIRVLRKMVDTHIAPTGTRSGSIPRRISS